LANEGHKNGYLVSVRIDLFPSVVAALLYLRCLSSAGLIQLGLR
jgi:spore maturation protein SpmB